MMVDETRPTHIPGVETFHPREVWQDPDRPVTGPAPTMDEWDTFPLHYTAADDLIDGDPGEHADQLDDYLRAVQRDYEHNRGYSIGYGFGVDWLGGVWELRGYDIKNAANRGWNHRTGPILCLVDGADPLTAEALWSVRALLREGNRRTGRTLNVVGHLDIGATACPGAGIYGQIQAGLVTPLTDAEVGIPHEGDDMETIEPGRWLDTRDNDGDRWKPGHVYALPAPFQALEVGINVSVADTTGPGFITVWGEGNEAPPTSNVRWDSTFGADNYSRIKPGPDGKIRFQLGGAEAHVVVDIQALRQ